MPFVTWFCKIIFGSKDRGPIQCECGCGCENVRSIENLFKKNFKKSLRERRPVSQNCLSIPAAGFFRAKKSRPQPLLLF